MDGFMTTKEAAEKWRISVRQVQIYCKKRRIEGVERVGTNYLIPKSALRPNQSNDANIILKADEHEINRCFRGNHAD